MSLHRWPQEPALITALGLSDFVTALRKSPAFLTPLHHHYGQQTRDLVGDLIVLESPLELQIKVSATLAETLYQHV